VSRKVIVEVTDDLDGSKADESVHFSLDGTNYEIDLSKKNAAKLRAGLEPYLKAAQKVGRAHAHPVAGRRGGPATIDRAQNQAIRAWAQRKGLNVSPRGRISQTIIEQYQAEAGR
jgi:nucleoid-associated protein Lsr2